MEREGRSHYRTRANNGGSHHTEPDSLLQWGNRKRLLCVKVQQPLADDNNPTTVRVLRPNTEKDPPSPAPARRTASQTATQLRSFRRKSEANGVGMNGDKGVSPERGAAMGSPAEEKKGSTSRSEEGAAAVWPKFAISLTTKEKEEDFLVFKGSKLPQRPKKRAKIIQRTLNLVSPGAWLCDLSLERYEVREKKTSNKRPRGLKAMGSMDGESE